MSGHTGIPTKEKSDLPPECLVLDSIFIVRAILIHAECYFQEPLWWIPSTEALSVGGQFNNMVDDFGGHLSTRAPVINDR